MPGARKGEGHLEGELGSWQWGELAKERAWNNLREAPGLPSFQESRTDGEKGKGSQTPTLG